MKYIIDQSVHAVFGKPILVKTAVKRGREQNFPKMGSAGHKQMNSTPVMAGSAYKIETQ